VSVRQEIPLQRSLFPRRRVPACRQGRSFPFPLVCFASFLPSISADCNNAAGTIVRCTLIGVSCTFGVRRITRHTLYLTIYDLPRKGERPLRITEELCGAQSKNTVWRDRYIARTDSQHKATGLTMRVCSWQLGSFLFFSPSLPVFLSPPSMVVSRTAAPRRAARKKRN
jgi:hypothetical protein